MNNFGRFSGLSSSAVGLLSDSFEKAEILYGWKLFTVGLFRLTHRTRIRPVIVYTGVLQFIRGTEEKGGRIGHSSVGVRWVWKV